jgi:hypothetical protein
MSFAAVSSFSLSLGSGCGCRAPGFLASSPVRPVTMPLGFLKLRLPQRH